MARILASALLTTLCVSSFCTLADARPGDRYSVEFAVLPTFEALHERHYTCTCWECTPGMRNVAVSPFDISQYRFSLWSKSALVVDFARLSIGDPRENYGHDDDRHFYEVGLGYDFGHGDEAFRPFATVLSGLILTVRGSDMRGYLGGCGGIRYFLRDWAAARLQLAYRKALADNKDPFEALELAVGMGFFL